jgi:hypothetical protein
MKKETIFLILFWVGCAIAIAYVIKLIRQMNDAITVSKS